MPITRPYKSKLREDQTAGTRQRIMDATHTLLMSFRPVDISYVQIAEASEVSVRTVYRHFPTIEELYGALAGQLFSKVAPHGVPATPADRVQATGAFFAGLSNDPTLFRLMFSVPIRGAISDEPKAPIHAPIVPQELCHLSPEDQRLVHTLLELQAGPYAWDTYKRYDLTPAKMQRLTEVAITAIVEFLQREPNALDPDQPHPTTRFLRDES